jgi:hypothetical protein
MTTYTTSLRLWEGTPLDPSIRGAWGPPLNENQVLLESAITDAVVVSIAGLTTYALTTANGAPDQARPLIQQYTGALTADCTVTLPNVPKYGYAINSTTGGNNVILTAGAGATATIPPDGRWYPYFADGATDVELIPLGLGVVAGTSGAFSGGVTVGTVLTVGTNLTVSGSTQTNGLTAFGSSGAFFANPNSGGSQLIQFAASQFLQFTTGTGFLWNTSGTTKIQAGTINLTSTTPTLCNGGSNFVVTDNTGRECIIGPAGTQSLVTSGLSTNMMTFNVIGQGVIGTITGNGSGGITYGSTSDKRLKIDDGAIDDTGRLIDRLSPRWFRWKSAEGDAAQPGFMAQQLARVFPWAVIRGKGKPGSKDFVPWQVDPAKLVPILVAEIQALRRRVDALEKGR